MALARIVDPTTEPLTIADVVAQLRLDATNVEPAPIAPAVAVLGQAGSVTVGTHRYRLTFVTADGETQGGDISDVITIASSASARVELTGIPIGGAFVTARRLYRTAAAGADFFLLATINDNVTTLYVDNISDGALGAGIPTTNTTSDPDLRAKIAEARDTAEGWLRRAILEQTWRLTLDAFPACDVIRLPRPSLMSVVSVKYLAWSGELLTLDPSIYTVDTLSFPGQIVLNYMKLWPLTLPQRNAVQIDFVCGYGATAASVPPAVLAGMKLLVADLYENRETTNVTTVEESLTLRRLFALHRFQEFA